MIYKDASEVRVGHLVTMCCEEDMFEVVPENLEDTRERVADALEDEPRLFEYEYWLDELSALTEMRDRIEPGIFNNDFWIAEITKRMELLREPPDNLDAD